ncbi:MAG: hypothetical protein LBS57_07690 [Treponema sp.]|jgi:two-component system chemotaxis sensor kinase CheA|nr:hypothetical protein [Treponema sp.]
MAERKQLSFPVFKDWIKKYQITIINAAVTIVLICIIAVVLLNRASGLVANTAEESINNLAGMTAKDIQARYQSYADIARTVAQIMSNYLNVETSRRRGLYNDTMLGVLVSNRELVSIYTIWKPDALDGLDVSYGNTEGSDETGRYISCYTRERGYVEFRAYKEYITFINPFAREEIITNPVFRSVTTMYTGVGSPEREALMSDIRIPIVVNTQVVGLVGITVNMTQLQALSDSIRPYGTGQAMIIANDGTIVASPDIDLRGVNLRFSPTAAFSADNTDLIYDSMLTEIPASVRDKNTLFVSYPFSIGATLTPWTVVTRVPLSTILTPISNLIRFSIIFIIIAGSIAALVIYLTSNSLAQRAGALQRDLEHATAMQDNLKYGLFLMDQNFNIQGAYSRALERILSVSDLKGKNFITVLSSSLKEKEQEGLKDYFDMILGRSFNEQMLEDINPINELNYTSPETGGGKSLRSSFTLVERGRAAFILGILEDISAEKHLEQQLAEAESKREEEMRTLFQVIQLDPNILADFIEDTEYEFDRINDHLKDKNLSAREVMVEIYQSVHAIKSNAVILNLENFSGSLHELENKIRNLRDMEDIPFDSVLHIIVEMESIMREKDILKAAVVKIRNFKLETGEDFQDRYILIKTLVRVCEKATEVQGKKVKFIVDDVDEAALEYGPRRAMKEILTQLVRNAVYHGIESPEERKLLGKEEEGIIRLSIKYTDNKINIKLSDNGRGIDFDRVRKKAEKLNLLHDVKDFNDKKRLMQIIFSPGFSTIDNPDYQAGRGIGLSLVKDRTRELHGAINIQTDAGKGAIFMINIPADMAAVNKVS